MKSLGGVRATGAGGDGGRWDYIVALDDELLKGGAVLSEWTASLVREADTAYCCTANVACVLAAQAAVEAHLRFEYFSPVESRGWGLHRLLRELESRTPLEPDLVEGLDAVRRYRNRWVHVEDPADDHDLLTRPDVNEREAEEMARLSLRVMRRVLYLAQWV